MSVDPKIRRKGETIDWIGQVRYKYSYFNPLKPMDAASRPGRMEYLLRKADYVNWHRQQSNQHILRSQQGFSEVEPSRPRACRGCVNYHGIAYGYSRDQRSMLVCGFHPYGWHGDQACPDWTSAI